MIDYSKVDYNKFSDEDLNAMANENLDAMSPEGVKMFNAMIAVDAPSSQAVPPPNQGNPLSEQQVLETAGIPTGMYPNITPEGVKSFLGMGADMGIEGVGATAGQIAGAWGGPAAPVTVPIGGFIGGSTGNAVAQARQLAMGERDNFSMPEVVGAGIASMVPGGQLAGAGGRKAVTEAGKQIAANLAGIYSETSLADEEASPLRVAFGVAGAIGGSALAKEVNTGNKIALVAEKKAANAEMRKTLEAAQNVILPDGRKVGYKILPSMTEESSSVNNAIEYLAGGPQTVHEIRQQNDLVTKAIIRKALGMPTNEIINVEALEAVRLKAGQVYEQVENISPRAKKAIAKFKEARDKENMFWRENDRSGTAESQRLAERAKQQKEAYLKLINKEIRAKDPSGKLQADFIKARTTIAKTHIIEDAFDVGSGAVAADILAKRLRRGKYPDNDDLTVIQRFAEAFNKAAKRSAGTTSSPLVHPLAVGTAAMVGGKFGGPAVGGAAMATMLFAPKGIRNMIRSEWYQKMATAPRYGTPVPQDASASIAQYMAMSTGRKDQEKGNMQAVEAFLANAGL